MRSVRHRTLTALASAVALAVVPLSALARIGDTVGDRVVGQPDASSNAPNATGVDASGLDRPYGAAFDAAGNLFVADEGNSRVLGYRSPLTTDLVADIVIGQPDFNSTVYNNGGISASTLSYPTGVAVSAAGDLYVADHGNSRVLEYDRPFATDTVADFVIGQPDFTTYDGNEENISAETLFSAPDLAVAPNGDLWVADGGHNRVLKYDDPVATRDAVADLVIGQPSFTTSSGYGNVFDARTLSFPTSVALDSRGNLWVTDINGNRALEYDDPSRSDAVADRVLGQPSFTSSAKNYTGSVDANGLFFPERIRLDANDNVYVADTRNNRVLMYTAPLATRDRVADRVFGQPDFATALDNAGGVSARSLYTPTGLAFDAAGDLAVVDFRNNRVVLIQAPTPIVSSLAVKVAAATGKAKLVVSGLGFESGRAVVEVNGVELETTRYKDVVGDGTAGRLVALDAAFDAVVPRGTPVEIVVVNTETGGRSAPFRFTRQ